MRMAQIGLQRPYVRIWSLPTYVSEERLSSDELVSPAAGIALFYE